jgi:dienelactone hydrolase
MRWSIAAIRYYRLLPICLLSVVASQMVSAEMPAPSEPAPNHAITAELDGTQLADALGSFEEGRWILAEAGPLHCRVRIYRYSYATVDGTGQPTTATAALMVPGGAAPQCSGPLPVVLALHGTTPDAAYDLADVSGSNSARPRALAWAGIFASRGYAVIAPNYAGFAGSELDYHPYHDRRQQTQDVIDALDAGRALLGSFGVSDNGKLFLTGFSQGGWVTMATHRELEARGRTVTASMPASGAYALAAVADDIFLGRPVQGSTIYFPLMITAYQRAYGDIYRSVTELVTADYAEGSENVLPSDMSWPDIVRSGRLPVDDVFLSGAPALPDNADPALAALWTIMGPEHARPHLRATNASGIGPQALISDDIRQAWLEDMARHPDGAWPTWTDGLAASRSDLPFRRAFIRNDLRGWIPVAPLTMCAGSSDQAVPIHLGAGLMMRYWSSEGRSPPDGRVTMIDFDEAAGPGDPYARLRADHAALRQSIVAEHGEQRWLDMYHPSILPRYCYTAARDWFDTMR